MQRHEVARLRRLELSSRSALSSDDSWTTRSIQPATCRVSRRHKRVISRGTKLQYPDRIHRRGGSDPASIYCPRPKFADCMQMGARLGVPRLAVSPQAAVMVPTASLLVFALAASGLQCNAVRPASVVGRHVGRHANLNLNVTVGSAGPVSKQQAGLVYKGFYEVASGERKAANRREKGFEKLAAAAAEKDGGGLVEDAPDATKPVYFDQCHGDRKTHSAHADDT